MNEVQLCFIFENKKEIARILFGIPPTKFELVSPDPKSCMIDRYTTGVFDNTITKFDCLLFFERRYYLYAF